MKSAGENARFSVAPACERHTYEPQSCSSKLLTRRDSSCKPTPPPPRMDATDAAALLRGREGGDGATIIIIPELEAAPTACGDVTAAGDPPGGEPDRSSTCSAPWWEWEACSRVPGGGTGRMGLPAARGGGWRGCGGCWGVAWPSPLPVLWLLRGTLEPKPCTEGAERGHKHGGKKGREERLTRKRPAKSAGGCM